MTLLAEPFFESITDDLVAALTLQTGSRHIGEELAQEAMARAWDRWSHVGRLDNPRGWVFRVGFNLANSRFRRRQAEHRAYRRLKAERVLDVDEPETGQFSEALTELPSRQREVIIFRFYLQYTVAETAEVLQISSGSVKTHTHRAVNRLGLGLRKADEVMQ